MKPIDTHAAEAAPPRYEPPAVIVETVLEVRAGTPQGVGLGLPELLDLDAQ
ncbi:MAG: hypothetical protein MUC51_08105 [Anaerolineae bacterium]|jgi:hypothetical protein|nr:hypothetical protein [Anaerolineae bacterium]